VRSLELSQEELEAGGQSITLENVHNASLFELRQSLMARGHFKADYEGEITYELLMHKMVQLLKEAKETKEAARIEEIETKNKTGATKENGGVETLAEKLAREKAERKAEAVERSRQRQADKAYFAAKKAESDAASELNKAMEEANLKERQLTDAEKADLNKMKPETVGGGLMGLGGGAKNEVASDDPFALKNRPKIGGKYA
jgi:hypothetical protein